MKRLLLLRHAKSSRDNARLQDFDRPLAKRGREAAPEIGRHMRKAGWLPDLVLCSTAKRTQETAELVLAELGGEADVRFVDALYLAAPEQMLNEIHTVDNKVRTLLVVAHNPGTALLANYLAASGDKKALQRLREKYPTAALAVFEIDADSWSKFDRATLIDFVTPKDIDD
ncbi:MAG TPA: histidine phosphatase family protein [Verrucomicrobiae bacterium]|nr:histidine phosphatase family protein [Verrucomicrobiae bacterium]